MDKPDFLTDDMLEYLDMLRESGVINMFGAAPFVTQEYGLSKAEGKQVLMYWMKTFGERHSQ